MQHFILTTIFITSLLYLGGGVLCQQQQLIQIFSGLNCTGTSLPATGSTSLNSTTYRSYAVTGLWKIRSCVNSTCENLGTGLFHQPLRTCTDFPFQNHTRMEVTRFGDENQRQKQITFYPGINLEGQPRMFGGNTSDINNFNYRSYFFTGNYSWTFIYGGVAVCVKPGGNINNLGYGITLVSNVPTSLLGSITEGCLAGTTPTTSTPTPTTTPKNAGLSLGSNTLIQMFLFSIAFLTCMTNYVRI